LIASLREYLRTVSGSCNEDPADDSESSWYLSRVAIDKGIYYGIVVHGAPISIQVKTRENGVDKSKDTDDEEG
jgi:hypothetical protein